MKNILDFVPHVMDTLVTCHVHLVKIVIAPPVSWVWSPINNWSSSENTRIRQPGGEPRCQGEVLAGIRKITFYRIREMLMCVKF